MPAQTVQSEKKLVILISGHGSNMEAILRAVEQHEIPARVSMVISDRSGTAGLRCARTYGIDTAVVERSQFADAAKFDAALTAMLTQVNPDLIALAGFMTILSAALVNRFAGKIMNIHPSLLPLYRGLHTHRRVLEAGDSQHGCSTHFVVSELDAGPIIIQARVEVLAGDTEQSLAQRVLAYEHIIYCRSIALYCSNRLRMRDGVCVLDGEPMRQPLYLA